MNSIKTIFGDIIIAGNHSINDLFLQAAAQNVSLKNADLEGIDLSYKEVKSVDLSGAKLGNSIIKNAAFVNCNLSNIDLSQSVGTNCKFISCNMERANVFNSNLNNALIEKCSIEFSIYRGSSLNGAKFQDCVKTYLIDFSFSRIDNASFVGKQAYINIDFGNLISAKGVELPAVLENCVLNHSKFTNIKNKSLSVLSSQLHGTELVECSIQKSIFNNCVGEGLAIRNCKMTETLLFGEYKMLHVENTDMSLSKLNGDFFRSHWKDSSLERSSAQDLNLVGAYFKDVNVMDSNFSLSKLQHSIHEHTNWQKANMNRCEIYKTTFTTSPLPEGVQLVTKATELDTSLRGLKGGKSSSKYLHGSAYTSDASSKNLKEQVSNTINL